MSELTADELRRLLSYDPETGVFVWRVARRNGRKPGDVAGTHDYEGYRIISVNGRRYKAHRAAWLYVHGEWPIGAIDHIDCDKTNNAIANLRQVTPSQNQHNQGKRRTNTSGYKGVHRPRFGTKWMAQIWVNGRGRVLGHFDTAEEAAAAYAEAARRLHGDFAKM